MSRFRHAEAQSPWVPLPLRLVIGYGFTAHGWAKMSRGPAGFAALLHTIGVPFPSFTASAITWIELLGGLAIFAGAFVAIVSVPLILTMLAAMFKVHVRYGFSSIRTIGLGPDGPLFAPPGYEVNLLYIASLLALMLGGAGAFSVDGWLARRRKSA
jgi:putative oxidoreductase